jgi:phospholipase/carboxylesterase
LTRTIHYIQKPATQQTPDNPTLIMLHGRGADENDLFGMADNMDPRLTIYSLRAPYKYEWGGFSWFELYNDGSVDEGSFQKSRNDVLHFISDISSKKVFLFGFSMGAIMSYAIALTNPGVCSGIACLSGFAPLQLEKEYALRNLHNLHIFASHGINDPVIPIAFARKTKELLDQSNAIVTYNEYDMAHEISEQCFADCAKWLQSLL